MASDSKKTPLITTSEGFSFDDLPKCLEYLRANFGPCSEHRITIKDKAYRLYLDDDIGYSLASIQLDLFQNG